MILSFRTWWRALLVLAALALLPLAWRGLERQPPILIQQIPAESAVPPATIRLAERAPSPARPPASLVVEAAGEPAADPEGGEQGPSEDARSQGDRLGPSAGAPAPNADCPPSAGAKEQPGAGEPAETPNGGATPVVSAGASSQPVPAERSGPRVNVNTADATTLETLPGIGPALAGRIIAYRERWGPFTSPEQLTEVSGIGAKRLEQLLPWITVE